MSGQLESLSDDEIHKIALIIDALEKSTFDFLQLQVGDIKLTIGTGSLPTTEEITTPVAIATAPQHETAPAEQLSTTKSAASGSFEHNEDSLDEGTFPIRAPIMGLFYDKPHPGAVPFVKVGSVVNEDTTVCLIEVMKLFQSVRAGLNGVISEVCVKDTEIVENGQILFRIQPSNRALPEEPDS
jgi:acetyl-CoA carboxylase biotin carboxyl carrier protein